MENSHIIIMLIFLLVAFKQLRGVLLPATVVIFSIIVALGLIPLLQDVFFVNMSLTIMAGLGFATLLTLLFVPTLYAILFGIKPPQA